MPGNILCCPISDRNWLHISMRASLKYTIVFPVVNAISPYKDEKIQRKKFTTLWCHRMKVVWCIICQNALLRQRLLWYWVQKQPWSIHFVLLQTFKLIFFLKSSFKFLLHIHTWSLQQVRGHLPYKPLLWKRTRWGHKQAYSIMHTRSSSWSQSCSTLSW